MALWHLIILALVQGITEFLPISSSAHLALVPVVLDAPDQGLMMDIAVHIGTLLAVLVYVWRDLMAALMNKKMCLCLVVATVPVVVVGFALHCLYPDGLRDIKWIAATTLVFAVALWWADRKGTTEKTMTQNMNWKTAFYIGLGQIFALIPGTSRSGVTMTVARLFGYNRVEAAKFSLLLGIPTIAGAGILMMGDVIRDQSLTIGTDIILAVVFSFLAALLSIILMMKWLEKFSFTPFVIYRLGLGAILCGYIFFG